MIVGVPKEIKNNENRVGLVPSGVKVLKGFGHQVLIEQGAGLGIGISDEMFEKSGATIIPSAGELWKRAEMIIKVKEPLPQEYGYLRENLILYTYLHLAAEPELTHELLKRKVTGVAYETIQLDDGSLPLLIPMSEVAGRMATQIGANYLQKDHGGKGILLGGVPGVKKGKVTVIGGGTAGTNSIQMAMGLGAQVTVLDTSLRRLEYLNHVFGMGLQTLFSSPGNIESAVKEADLVIGAVLIAGAKAPKLVSRSLVSQMEEGSVIVDISVDQGGCIETCRPTVHTDPTFVVDGVIHYCVANMPGAVAKTSTFALTNATLRYACKLANDGVEKALSSDVSLYKGLNTYKGKLTNKAVAESLKLEFSEYRI